MLISKIKSDLEYAQKAQDKIKVSTLRLLLAKIHNVEIAKGGVLADDEIYTVINQFAKQNKESIEAFEKAKRLDLRMKEEKELEILKLYLPSQLSQKELEAIISEIIKKTGAKEISDFGKVMSAVMLKVKGKADGSEVSNLVKNALTN